MHVCQFVHTLNYGDAISGEALTIHRTLSENDIASSLYSVHAHEKVKKARLPYTQFASDYAAMTARGESVVLLLHYSIASPLNDLVLQTEGVVRALIYHNLTPVEWFTSYNERVARDLIVGREELPSLVKEMDIVLADSSFNRDELSGMGYQGAEVLPLPLDETKWGLGANSGIARMLKASGKRNLLHVGRFAPNKCIEDIIKGFYFYHHKIEKKSHLWLIGSDIDTEIYSFELRRLISELLLREAVTIVGTVSDCELRAFYENSDLYLVMSEHEGFCVPLLEAMHFGLPIIAYQACAIPETLGDAGVLISRKSPADLGELMHAVLEDEALRTELKNRGLARVRLFSESAFSRMLTERFIEPAQNILDERRVRSQAG